MSPTPLPRHPTTLSPRYNPPAMTQLHLDLQNSHTYLNNPWAFGVNVGRAALLLRKDVQRQLLIGRDELGFRHVRFEGGANGRGADGSYGFTGLERVLDWLMENGFAPYLVLPGPPGAAAGDGSPAAGDWVDGVSGLAAFVDGRYGCDAQEWHFEVWPAPDDPARWAGDQAAYFRLYDLAARAVKSVNGQLKVGGPGAADPGWVEAFVDHVAQPSEAFGLDVQRCDFVTVGGLPSAGPADAAGLVEHLKAVRSRVTTALGETTPVLLASWSAAGREPGPAHDACAAGASVAAAMAPLADVVNGALYAVMSDIDAGDEAATRRFEPFHGGPGLLTVNDVRKPSFNVLKLLNEHLGYKLDGRWEEPTDGLTALVSRDYHHVVRILAAYHRPGATGPARFTIEGLPDSVRYGQVQVIRPSAGSPLEAWAEQGSPPFVNRNVLDDLEAASHPATTEVNFREYPPRLEPGMTLQLTIPMPDDAGYTD